MKPSGIFDRVRFLESRIDRMEAIILAQDQHIRDLVRGSQMATAVPSKAIPERRRMAQIAADVACDNGLTLDEMKAKTFAWAVSHPRQHAYAVMLDAGFSAASIGRFFKVDHSTVISGAKAARARAEGVQK